MLWTTTNAQNVEVPIDLLRDYNLTKEALKVSRDTIILLNAEKLLWMDSTAFYKGKYLREHKRKKNWRLIAVVLGVKEVVSICLKRINSPFGF